jgi:hypothetical protein
VSVMAILQELTGQDRFAICSAAAAIFRRRSYDPIDDFQASFLFKLEKLDWGSILDNKSDGHAR